MRKVKGKEIASFFGKEATLIWDLDWWRWVEGYHFFNYTSKLGRDVIINKIFEKWQRHFSCNYKFYWRHIWDSNHYCKE